MDEFYQSVYSMIAYNWIGSLAEAHKGKSSRSICFCKNQYHGKMSFFDDNIIDLRIEDINTKESIFYLHFQIKNLKMLTENIQSFFDCLNQQHDEACAKEDIIIKENLNILLTCSTGLTTSYFAYLLDEYFQQAQLNIKVDAVGYQELDVIQSQYDFIFVAPQISYLYTKLQEKYGQKVFLIDSYDFATGNIKSVLNKIDKSC